MNPHRAVFHTAQGDRYGKNEVCVCVRACACLCVVIVAFVLAVNVFERLWCGMLSLCCGLPTEWWHAK